jgi:hypothetical protein
VTSEAHLTLLFSKHLQLHISLRQCTYQCVGNVGKFNIESTQRTYYIPAIQVTSIALAGKSFAHKVLLLFFRSSPRFLFTFFVATFQSPSTRRELLLNTTINVTPALDCFRFLLYAPMIEEY